MSKVLARLRALMGRRGGYAAHAAGLGLFAALNVLPKYTAMSTFAYLLGKLSHGWSGQLLP